MPLRDLIPIPDPLAFRTVLVVAPHPDDAVIGAGAILARLADAGAQITVVNVTSGESGSMDPTTTRAELKAARQREERESARLLGVTETCFLDLPDFGGLTEDAVTQALLPVLRRLRPDAVFFPDPWLLNEFHPDHRRVGLGTAGALLAAPFPLVQPAAGPPCPQPAAALYATSRPNRFVAAGPYWEKKRKALLCHQSQFSEPQANLLLAFLAEATASAPGGEGPKEPLRLLSPYHMHMNPFAETL